MAPDVTDASFQQDVIEGSRETLVLVDFWAEWCGPCHAVSPVLEKIAAEREGTLRLVKLNIDENQETAQTYGVMSIPTMILFKDGEPAAATIGARPKGDIEKQLGLEPVSA
jgi:thioredoxin 1